MHSYNVDFNYSCSPSAAILATLILTYMWMQVCDAYFTADSSWLAKWVTVATLSSSALLGFCSSVIISVEFVVGYLLHFVAQNFEAWAETLGDKGGPDDEDNKEDYCEKIRVEETPLVMASVSYETGRKVNFTDDVSEVYYIVHKQF